MYYIKQCYDMNDLLHLYNGEFRAKIVMVTGANQGIGLELIRIISSCKPPPLRLFAACINPVEAQELNELSDKWSFIEVVQLALSVSLEDLTDNISVMEAVAIVDKQTRSYGLNCLINNAGVSLGGGLSRVTAQKMVDNYTVNVVGPLMLTKALLPCIKRAAKAHCHLPACCARACIINISSILGSIEHVGDTRGGQYAYRASKAALNMLTQCLSYELKSDDIITISLHPGWVRTSMGGPQAPLSANQSAAGCLATIASLNASDSGRFLDWKGQVLPW